MENKYYNNNIEWDHYIDNGCLCMVCSKKRNEIVKRLKMGVKTIKEKIIHDNELLKREIILKRSSIMNEKMKKQANLNDVYNTIFALKVFSQEDLHIPLKKK